MGKYGEYFGKHILEWDVEGYNSALGPDGWCLRTGVYVLVFTYWCLLTGV